MEKDLFVCLQTRLTRRNQMSRLSLEKDHDGTICGCNHQISHRDQQTRLKFLSSSRQYQLYINLLVYGERAVVSKVLLVHEGESGAVRLKQDRLYRVAATRNLAGSSEAEWSQFITVAKDGVHHHLPKLDDARCTPGHAAPCNPKTHPKMMHAAVRRRTR